MYIIASRTCVCGELGELEARSCVRGETRARCRTARRRAQAERGQPGGIRTRRCWSGTLHIDIFSHQNQEEESIASVKTDYIMGLTNLTVDWQWQSVCSAVWNMLATNTMEHSGKEHRGTHSETQWCTRVLRVPLRRLLHGSGDVGFERRSLRASWDGKLWLLLFEQEESVHMRQSYESLVWESHYERYETQSREHFRLPCLTASCTLTASGAVEQYQGIW